MIMLKHFYFITLAILIVAADAQSIGQIVSSNVCSGIPVANSEKATDDLRVDNTTLRGKVMCGYQGWFGAPGDGSLDDAWRHWTKKAGSLADGNAKIDLWPDVSELSPAERFRTDFKLASGQPAEVFSSVVKPTVLRHFQWMQEYGIDGVFVQRFAHGLDDRKTLSHDDAVLSNCREGADTYGRTYAIMYDLTGLSGKHMSQVMDDWRKLKKQMGITKDRTYLFHHGKPLVAIWGIGFKNRQSYNLDECRQLIEFLKNDPEAGGCTVMLGVPAHWRELTNDAVNDPELLKIISMADVVSPWSVGRYADVDGARKYADTILAPDAIWCREHNIDYMPVVFPGFSRHNMYGGPPNQIPRLHGQFLWSQFCSIKRANIPMAYVAMFDEVDEGTAIFKCANDVPTGTRSQFVTFEGLPSDFYLRLVGKATKLIRGEIPLTAQIGDNEFSQAVKTSSPTSNN